MPRRTTRHNDGPDITEIEFNVNEVEAALKEYAEARGGNLLNGPVEVGLLPSGPGTRKAVLRIRHVG
jgi:hypothetical protein